MPYTLRRSDGAVLLNIPDQTINKIELPIALVGRGAINYGTDFAENFIHMLENFANLSPPSRPLVGMIWYDLSENELKLWTGTAWRSIVGNTSVQPLPSTIVYRDENGNIHANVFIGNAQTADKWKTARSLTLTGDATGSTMIDGSSNVVLQTTIQRAAESGHALTSDKWTTGRRIKLVGQVEGEAVIDGSADVTIACLVTNVTGEAIGTPDNIANQIVRRDSSGNFATTRITANLVGNVTGNADTANKLQTARTLALVGNVTGSVSFDGSADASITTTIASIPASALPASGVTAGSYTLASVTVGTDGRITAASNGSLPASGVTPGSYTLSSITVGADGRITAASSGAAGSTDVPPHRHPVSDIDGLDNRINEVTNVSTIKGMRRVAGPNVSWVIRNAAINSPSLANTNWTYRTPVGAFMVGHFSQYGPNEGPVVGQYHVNVSNYFITEYIQYYINGSWVTIA